MPQKYAPIRSVLSRWRIVEYLKTVKIVLSIIIQLNQENVICVRSAPAATLKLCVCVCVPSQQPASHDCEKDLLLQLCISIIGPQELLRDKKYAWGLFIHFTYASVCEYDFLPRHLFLFACLCVWNFWTYCICRSAWSWLSAKKLLWLIE